MARGNSHNLQYGTAGLAIILRGLGMLPRLSYWRRHYDVTAANSKTGVNPLIGPHHYPTLSLCTVMDYESRTGTRSSTKMGRVITNGTSDGMGRGGSGPELGLVEGRALRLRVSAGFLQLWT
jgi:hypothetical protein